MNEMQRELAAVRLEQQRMDAKCGTLTAVAGAVTAILASQIPAITRLPLPVRLQLAAATVAFAAAALVLLAGVLRPRLGTTGFRRYARMTPMEIADFFAVGDHGDRAAEDLAFLSTLVARKQRRLRAGVDLLIAGLVLIGVALVLAALA